MLYQMWLRKAGSSMEGRVHFAFADNGDQAMNVTELANPGFECYRWKQLDGMASDTVKDEKKRYELQMKDVKAGEHFIYVVHGYSPLNAEWLAVCDNPGCVVESCRELNEFNLAGVNLNQDWSSKPTDGTVIFEPNMVDFCSDRRELSDKIRSLKEEVARLKGLVRELQLHIQAKAEYLGVVNSLNDDHVREIEHLRACIKMFANEPY